ncbi:MAG: hypothetical protein ACXVCY_13180 [Pseudobdellovibrionaceae bacterium]
MKAPKKAIQQHFLLSILTTSLIYLIYRHTAFIDIVAVEKELATVLQSLVSILGSILGFIVSTVAILAAVLETPSFERLHRSNKTHELISAFMGLIFLTGGNLAISLTAQVIHKMIAPAWVELILFFVGTWWIIKFVYCMVLFKHILAIRYTQPKAEVTL